MRRKNRPIQRIIVIGLALAMMSLLPSPAVAVVSPSALQWWPLGVTGASDGFHMRIPVTVRNTHTYPVQNGAVVAEIDIAQRLIDAGWVKQPRGGTDVLRSFEFDEGSVRVIPMTNLEPATHGTTNGLLRAHDATRAASDPDRYVLPSVVFTGSLLGASSVPFNARTNPYITVLWRVDATLAPGETRAFVVYVDSLTNGDHAQPEYVETKGAKLLDRTFWSGPGTDLLGIVAPPASTPGRVTVVGLHSGTSVQVQLAGQGGLFEPQPPSGIGPNPFTIGAGEMRDVFVSNTFGTVFRLVSSKPIIAFVDSEGYVPTPAGEIEGTDFFFGSTYTGDQAQDSLFVLNRHPQRAPTVVRLTELASGTTRDIHLSDATNQYPYTLGAAVTEPEPGDEGCTFPEAVEAPRLTVGARHYKATVVSGGPISIQLQPKHAITQLPSMDGRPQGTDFWSALSRSGASFTAGTCLRNVQQHGIFASATGAARFEITSPENPLRVVPPCATLPCGQGLAFGPAPDQSLDARTFDTSEYNDRPLNLHTTAPALVMISPTALEDLSDAIVRGPIGGANVARSFVGFGPTLIYAPFEGTIVNARIHHAISGPSDVELRPIANRVVALPETGDDDPVTWYSLAADRPLLVLPTGAGTGFLGGLPPMLDATVHDADFRGHLVEIRSPTGFNPVTASSVPGAPSTFEFLVTNRGRGVGGEDLPDVIELAVDAPSGWSAAVFPDSIRLSSGQTEEVELRVTPPAGAAPGELGAVAVTAMSSGNPRVFDSVETVTHVKRSFDVGLWFDQVETGPKNKQLALSAGQERFYDLLVKNKGTVADRVSLRFTAPDAGWQVSLRQGTQEVSEVALSANGEVGAIANLRLHVTGPPVAGEDLLLTTITATSQSSSTARDQVVAISKLRAPSHLLLVPENLTQLVRPGQEALFNMTLINDGLGTTEVLLEVLADGALSWSPPTVFLRGATASERTVLERISVGPGDRIPIAVNITPSASSKAGNQTSLRFNAATPNVGEGVEEFFYALVKPVHRLQVDAPTTQLAIEDAVREAAATFRVTNTGNLDESLAISVGSVPAGWVAHPSANLLSVPIGRTQSYAITLRAPAGVTEGAYTVTLRMLALDGNETLISVPIKVARIVDQTITLASVTKAQPGRAALAEYLFENRGNVPLDVRVTHDGSEPWALADDAGTLRVPPGARMPVRVGWAVPRDASVGESTHKAVFIARTSGGADVRRTVEATFDVARPELRVSEANSFLGPSGWIVKAVVVNDGQRPALNVDVVLRVGGESVDAVVLGEIPVGEQREILLLQPQERSGSATLLVDPFDTVSETDEANNGRVLTAPATEEPAKSPGLGILALLVATGFVLVRRRRG